MSAGSLSLRTIVATQRGVIGTISWLGPLGGVGKFIPHWYIFSHLPSFVIFLLAGVAETNRPPFDLAEADTELVGGYHTEYSGIKFAMFFLAEYLHVVTISALAVLLFLGGLNGIPPPPPVLAGIWPLLLLVRQALFVVLLLVGLPATPARLRYLTLIAVAE